MKHRDSLLWTFPRAAIAVLLLLFCTINTTLAQTTLPAEDIAEKALAATVYLEMKDSNGKILGFGSGFFIKSNLIATNYHVIEGAARGTAKLVGKHTTYNIEGTTATDKTNDLALLKVTAYGIKPLPLGDSDTVRIGETVYVAGNPKGLEGTFSDGIISSRRDKYTKERLQMTAPISPGSSGGPVLNRKGEVIGVSVSAYQALDAQNLNFAIPSNVLKVLLAQSSTAKPLTQNNRTISAETYERRGREKIQLENYKGAIEDFTRAIHLKPNYGFYYYSRGYAKYLLGQYSASIVDYDTAIRLETFNFSKSFFYHARGIAKENLGQHFAAIQDFDKAIQLKPYDASSAYNSRGIAKTSLRQHFAAIQDFDKAIQLRPDFALAYVNRGVSKSKLGQDFAAIQDYDKAIQLKPDHTLAYYNRGNAKHDLKQYLAAIQDYNMVIRLNPNYTKAYINRGVAKINLDRTSEAKQDFRMALKLAEKAGDANLKADIESMLKKVR